MYDYTNLYICIYMYTYKYIYIYIYIGGLRVPCLTLLIEVYFNMVYRLHVGYIRHVRSLRSEVMHNRNTHRCVFLLSTEIMDHWRESEDPSNLKVIEYI
jgi:hypothetical protein